MANYVLLGRQTLSQSAASVTLNNIPQSGYTDLKIVISARTTNTADNFENIKLQFNGSGGTAYSDRLIYGNGSSALSASNSSQAFTYFQYADAGASTANTYSSVEIYVPNYTSSNFKSISVDAVTENNASGANSAIASLAAELWSNTAAITSISFTPNVASGFAANSTFSIYGIAAVGTTPVIAPYATGGDTITNDGTYWIHTFLTTGTFTPTKTITCDYLVVAGGGSGAVYPGGGGGAGGYRYFTSQSLASGTAYTATVGGGGAYSTSSGTNSSFNSNVSAGGGYGGNDTSSGGTYSVGSGGSGGGASPKNGGGSNSPAGSGNTPATTPVQGYGGGNAAYVVSATISGGGGGGAGGIGGNATASVAGAAGAGVANSISGTSVTYATGGRGAGDVASAPSTNIANTGNGGYAGYWNGSSAPAGVAGNSGIIIIRYPMA